MNIYCISGLGADKRAFDFLVLEYELKHLEWIDPFPNETIEAYAERLSEGIDQDQPFVLIGLSFGGMVAVEIAKITLPVCTIQISSVDHRDELPKLYRFIGKTGITRLLPKFCFNIPTPLAAFAFQTNNKRLLSAIIKDSDAEFTKWAVNAILNWRNEQKIKQIIQIGGEKDLILPSKRSMNHIVKGGGHFMIVDKADELSEILNQELAKLELL